MSITATGGSSPRFVAHCNDHRNESSRMHRPPCPDALRCPELHDFSDLRDPSGRVNRSLIVVLLVAALLTIGHFVRNGNDATLKPVAEQQTMQPSG